MSPACWTAWAWSLPRTGYNNRNVSGEGVERYNFHVEGNEGAGIKASFSTRLIDVIVCTAISGGAGLNGRYHPSSN